MSNNILWHYPREILRLSLCTSKQLPSQITFNVFQCVPRMFWYSHMNMMMMLVENLLRHIPWLWNVILKIVKVLTKKKFKSQLFSSWRCQEINYSIWREASLICRKSFRLWRCCVVGRFELNLSSEENLKIAASKSNFHSNCPPSVFYTHFSNASLFFLFSFFFYFVKSSKKIIMI